MLSQVAVASTAKQIAVSASVAGTLMYVVPVGKKFTGLVSVSGVSAGVSINGAALYPSASAPAQITLLGGTSVSLISIGNGGPIALIGVEQ